MIDDFAASIAGALQFVVMEKHDDRVFGPSRVDLKDRRNVLKRVVHGLYAVLGKSGFRPATVAGDDRLVPWLIVKKSMELLRSLRRYTMELLGLCVGK